MSIRLTSSAWQTDLPAGQKIVLLALCNWANENGECWPTVATICDACGASERTVQSHLASLEAAGYIERSLRSGGATHYTVRLQVPL